MPGRGARLLNALAERKMRDEARSDEKKQIDSLGGLLERVHLDELICSENKTTELVRSITGKPVSLVVNYMKVLIEREPLNVYQYRVDFEPEQEIRSVRTGLVSKLIDSSVVSVYDGRSIIYTCNQEIDEIKLFDSDSKCKLFVRQVKKYVNELPCYVLNTLFRQIMADLRYQEQKRKYFNLRDSIVLRHCRLEVWPGLVTSAIYTKQSDGNQNSKEKSHLLLCLDVCHRVVRTITCYQMYDEFRDAYRGEGNWKTQFKNSLVGSVVLTRYNNKTYRVDDVLFDETSSSGFQTHNGEFMSFRDYYMKTYSLKMVYDNQPLIVSRNRNKGNHKNPETFVKLIPEFCYLTGLTDALRTDFKAMKDLTAIVHLDPNQRAEKLNKYIENVLKSEDAQHRLSRWHLRLSKDFIHVPGRVLPSETVKFANEQGARVSNSAEWSRELARYKIANPVTIRQWLIVCPSRYERLLNFFSETSKRESLAIGMTKITTPIAKLIPDDQPPTYVGAISSSMENTRSITLVVCIVPDQREDRYSAIKKTCCVAYPVASQVILTKSLSNANKLRTIVQRVMMQIVCKLGGHLWSINIPVRDLMIIGVDVYHHGNDSLMSKSGDISHRRSSVVGVVSSLSSSNATQWFSRASMQASNRQEIADGLRVCYVDALRHFHSANGSLPSKVLIYRDSMGDSQIPVIIEYEIGQFKKATLSFGSEYNPQIIAIAVNKRIQSRMFNLNSQCKWANPASGTVCDTDIARFSESEFLLVSQSVRQGSVSPTRYVIVSNTSDNMNIDRIQRITYKLTHMYYNWPGTVAIPAPCLYAHKLAYLVGQYLRREPDASLSDRLFYL